MKGTLRALPITDIPEGSVRSFLKVIECRLLSAYKLLYMTNINNDFQVKMIPQKFSCVMMSAKWCMQMYTFPLHHLVM